MRKFSIPYRLISLILMIQILTGTVGYAITRTECKITGESATTINQLSASCLKHQAKANNNTSETSAEKQNCSKHKHHECCSKKGKHKKNKACCSTNDKNCCTTVSRGIHLNPFSTSVEMMLDMSSLSIVNVTPAINFINDNCHFPTSSKDFNYEPPEPLGNREILNTFSRLII